MTLVDEQGLDQSFQGMDNHHGVQVHISRFVIEKGLVLEGASIGDPGGGVEVPSSLRGSVEICSSDWYFYIGYVEVI